MSSNSRNSRHFLYICRNGVYIKRCCRKKQRDYINSDWRITDLTSGSKCQCRHAMNAFQWVHRVNKQQNWATCAAAVKRMKDANILDILRYVFCKELRKDASWLARKNGVCVYFVSSWSEQSFSFLPFALCSITCYIRPWLDRESLVPLKMEESLITPGKYTKNKVLIKRLDQRLWSNTLLTWCANKGNECGVCFVLWPTTSVWGGCKGRI